MSSKGVTPVIATVLLITISIAATGAAYTFIIDTQDQAANNFKDRLSDEKQKQNADINIEHVYEGGSGSALLAVRNTGSVSQRVKNNGKKKWNVYKGGELIPGSDWEFKDGSIETLSPDETVIIDTNRPYPSAGNRITYKVVGRYESQAEYNCFVDSGGSSSC